MTPSIGLSSCAVNNTVRPRRSPRLLHQRDDARPGNRRSRTHQRFVEQQQLRASEQRLSPATGAEPPRPTVATADALPAPSPSTKASTSSMSARSDAVRRGEAPALAAHGTAR